MANIIQINGKKVKDVNAARMSSLAPVESSTTASMAHAVGDYFWLNGTLYEATAAITVGNAFSVGTNCKITNMGENLANLKSQINGNKETKSKTVSTTANTTQDFNQGYKKGTKLRLSLSADAGILTTSKVGYFTYFNTSNQQKYLIPSLACNSYVDYTLTEDASKIRCTIGSNRVSSAGTVDISVEIISVYTRLEDILSLIGTTTTELQNYADADAEKIRDGLSYSSTFAVVNATEKQYNYTLPKTIKAGTRVRVEVSAANGVLNLNGGGYFLDDNGSITSVWQYPAYFSPSTDITLIGIRLYANSIASSGNVTLNIKVLGLDDAYDDIEDLMQYVGLNDYFLPKYYNESYTDTSNASHDDYLAWKADRINTLAKSALSSGDAFFFITDQHWSQNAKNSPAIIRYLAQNTNIRKVFNGGDTGDKLAGVPYVKKIESLFCGEAFYAMGNHEFEQSATNSELVYAFDMPNEARQIGGSPNGHYYYVNNNYQKIRYVILCGDGAGYTTEQKNWFENVALNVDDGWKIVVITHWIIFFWGTDTVYWGNQSAHDIADICDTFNASATNGKEVIAIFQGHTHRDRVYYTDGGLPIIVTACDKYIASNTGVTNDQDEVIYDINVPREKFTVSEQTFDGVIINISTRKIHLVRVGGHARDGVGNEPGDEVEERTVDMRSLT